jgi:spore coat protein CotH
MEPPAPGELPEGFEPPARGERPEGMAAPADMPGGFNTENPMWVEATIEFDGNTWNHVGVRYKGNSSLMSSWNSGSQKLPFKFDFDEFEDDYPEIDNQRFYGFKQLSLANGFSDSTFMRDAITYDLLDEAGLVAAETAFYNIFLDYGEGPVDFGLYTMIEVIDDTVVERYFGDDDGNLYEGDGRGVSLAEGTYEQIANSFQKENNEDEADWSDIETLYTVLHTETRLTDAQAWRVELEAVFDVDAFLEWLAISAVIGHWDTYGAMPHNFYLYNNPETGQLTWISWDHNMTMGGEMGDAPNQRPGDAAVAGDVGMHPERGPGGMSRSSSLDKADVGESWPLIRYLLDDPIYYADYVAYVEAAGTELFTPARIEAKVSVLTELLAPYAVAEIGEAEFAEAVQQLIEFAHTRAAAVTAFLSE